MSKSIHIDTKTQIVVDALQREIEQREIALSAHNEKENYEISQIREHINNLLGRTRKQRSDKGRKRSSSQVVLTAVRGRKRQDAVLTSFDKNATFEQKVVFAIASANRFVHNREIGKFLHSNDPSFSEDEYVRKLSKVAGRLRRIGAFVTIQIGDNIRNTFYGLLTWVDANNNPKPGYEYNENYLVGKRTG